MDGWTPDRKVTAAAIAAIAAWLAQELAGLSMPPGIEAAIATVVAYLVPSTRTAPLQEPADD